MINARKRPIRQPTPQDWELPSHLLVRSVNTRWYCLVPLCDLLKADCSITMKARGTTSNRGPQMKQCLLIYDRREIILFGVASILFSLFTFTLGLHFGKQFVPILQGGIGHPSMSVTTLPDTMPQSVDLLEQAPDITGDLDVLLSDKLHQAVQSQKLKLDPPQQLVLPNNTKSPNAGKTTF